MATKKFLHTTILCFLLILGAGSSVESYGQIGTSTYGYDLEGFGTELEDEMATDADSTRQVKVRKPLESYFFDDSIRKQEIFVWHVDTYKNAVHMTGVDTTISGLQVDYPFIKRGVGHAYQGNMGGASIPLSYFDRPVYQNFEFAQAFDTYFYFPENTNFYNVKKVFTHFSYYTAGQTKRREEGFYITHAQNISPSTGFNIDYKSRGTRGYYAWSKGRDKNLSMAFNHTGKKYTVHAGYIYNTVNNKENGGIINDRDITDTIYELAENIPVQLNDARNIIKNNAYYLIQSYGVPLRKLTEDDFTISDQSSLFFGHSLTYSRWNRTYTDTKSQSGDFYDNWYIYPTYTYDSIFESLLANRLFVQIQPFDRDGIVGLIDAGAGVDVHYYYRFLPNDYISGRTQGTHKTDYYVYGGVEGKFRSYFDWGGDIVFYPAGNRSGDLKIGANASVSASIKGNPITLSGKFVNDLRSPGYWTENYFSNHYVWSNSFNKENESRIEISLSMPSFAFEVGASQSVVTDKIYYDANALPAQHSGSVSISGLYASKDFRFRGLHLQNRVMLQWSTSEEVVPVPLLSAYLSYYYEFDVVKNVLRAQVGVDARYNTKYYAFGYMPSHSAFYNQREKQIGGYPVFDFYLSGKWKRMRILLKMEHLNENLIGRRNYFTVLHYPLAKRVFKLGFSWAFYD